MLYRSRPEPAMGTGHSMNSQPLGKPGYRQPSLTPPLTRRTDPPETGDGSVPRESPRRPAPWPEGSCITATSGYGAGRKTQQPRPINTHQTRRRRDEDRDPGRARDYDPTTKAVAVPIYQTTSYAFDDTQHGADLFDLKVQGNIYTRIMNPTTDVLEQRVSLEGGVGALALSSGMAAITDAVFTVAQSGDNIVTTTQLYGGTYNLFATPCPGWGSRCVSWTPRTSTAWRPRSMPRPRPCSAVHRQPGRQRGGFRCHCRHGPPRRTADRGQPVPPYLCRPFEHGADVVVHALTKYMGGHGNNIGGIVVDSGKFPWADNAERFHAQRAGCLLPRRGLYRGPGRGRLHRPLPGGAAAQHGRHLALQQLPDHAGHRDPAGAHGPPLRERRQGGLASATAPQGGLGQLRRPAGPPGPRTGAEVHGRQGLQHLSFGIHGGREAGAASSTPCNWRCGW